MKLTASEEFYLEMLNAGVPLLEMARRLRVSPWTLYTAGDILIRQPAAGKGGIDGATVPVGTGNGSGAGVGA